MFWMALFTAFLAVCAIRPSAFAQTSPPDKTDVAEGWENDMSYGFLLDREPDTKAALAIVESVLRTRQKAYPRFRIGNLAFVEIITAPPPGLTDVTGTTEYVGVILGAKPRLVPMPNKALFAHFAKNVRPDPEKLRFDRRIRAALILATGSDHYLSGDDVPGPTWTDENGTLVIRYQKFVGQGMMRPKKVDCTLTTDDQQAFILDCSDTDEATGL